jgi:hypothetical protein
MFLINKYEGRFYKMKRKLIFVLGILLFFGFVSVNCNAQSSTNDQRIVGTWVGILDGKSYTIVLNANGTGTEIYDGKTTNLFWGVSPNGEIFSTTSPDGNGGSYEKYSMSPDGRRMFIGKFMYQKK